MVVIGGFGGANMVGCATEQAADPRSTSMKPRFFGKLSAWIFILVGVGHTHFQLFETSANSGVTARLQQIQVQLPAA